ncbi:MAG: protein kinase [Terriglobia bacterium]|jgi:serine/threonine-protein kinase
MKSCPTCKATYPNEFVVCPQDGASLVELGEWTEGTVIRSKYRVVSKLGKGGMGTVYKVMHVAFNEVHALKVINPSLMSDDLFVKRFKHEAVVTRKLRHPNAVRVDDIDEAEDGRPIIVMEYIEGQSLKRLIKDLGPLPVPRVCTIIKQAAAALDAAHRLGMIHRDIKPDNIVLISTPEGEQAKVLDFGIAKLKETQTGELAGVTLTEAGTVVGTPAYMSPEQAEGKRGDELDGRADIYSLGIVMYQMLTGELPFKADTSMAMLLARLQKPPAPILSQHPELQIPEAIAKVVMKTLEKNPDHRPQNAELLIKEIEAAEQRIELATPALGVTRVVEPSAMKPRPVEPASAYSPAEAARALRDSLQAGGPGARRSAQPAVVSPELAPTVPPPAPPPVPRPRPVAPRTEPVPQPVQVYAAPAPRKSSTGVWIAVSVLAVVLVAGVLYVIQQRSLNQPENPVSPAGQTAPVQTAPGTPATGETGTPSQPSGTPSSPSSTGAQTPAQQQPAQAPQEVTAPSSPRVEKAASRTQRRPPAREQIPPPRTRKRTEENPAPKPAVDPAKIAAAINLGKFYLNRGEYDNAIAEFQQGLDLDPQNADLLNLIQRAKRAKEAESRFAQ